MRKIIFAVCLLFIGCTKTNDLKPEVPKYVESWEMQYVYSVVPNFYCPTGVANDTFRTMKEHDPKIYDWVNYPDSVVGGVRYFRYPCKKIQ